MNFGSRFIKKIYLFSPVPGLTEILTRYTISFKKRTLFKFPIWLLMLFFYSGFSQIGIKGSYCIGAIGKDGIILAADSRGILFDPDDIHKSAICYFDSIQKIFIVNRFGLSFIGNSTVNNQYLKVIIDDYAASDFAQARGDSIIYHFLRFCKKIFNSDSVYDSFIKGTKIMSIGYEDDTAYVCWYDEAAPYKYIKNQKNNLVSASPDYFRPVYSDTLACSDLAKRAEKSILKFANEQGFTDIIGGETYVLRIKKDGSYEWLLHSPEFTRKWITTDDVYKDFTEGKIKLTPVKGKTKDDVSNLFNH